MQMKQSVTWRMRHLDFLVRCTKRKKKTMKISKENLQDIQDAIKKQHLHYDNSKKRRERYRNYN